MIRAMRSRAVNVPLPKPHPTAGGLITTAPLVLIDITTDDGAVGRSYVFTYSTLALLSVKQILDDLAPLVVGQRLAPRTIFEAFQSRFRLLGAVGFAGMAIGGIDMALWDALAVTQGLPLYRLLGADRRPLPAYQSLGMMPAEEAVHEAQQAVSDGFRGVKFKMGGAGVHEDYRFTSAVRSAIGDDVELMVDYNQSLGPSEAIRRGRALEELGLAWLEEPCRYDDDAGHAAVARALDTPILFGENWWSAADAARAIALGACDEVMLDVMKIGGVTGWLAAAPIAATASRTVSSHLFTEYSAHLIAASATGRYVEWLDLVSPVLEEPLLPSNGEFVLPDRAGAGITWREDAVAHYAYG